MNLPGMSASFTLFYFILFLSFCVSVASGSRPWSKAPCTVCINVVNLHALYPAWSVDRSVAAAISQCDNGTDRIFRLREETRAEVPQEMNACDHLPSFVCAAVTPMHIVDGARLVRWICFEAVTSSDSGAHGDGDELLAN